MMDSADYMAYRAGLCPTCGAYSGCTCPEEVDEESEREDEDRAA
jgi:hypothetical protein